MKKSKPTKPLAKEKGYHASFVDPSKGKACYCSDELGYKCHHHSDPTPRTMEEIINNKLLPDEGKKWEWAKELSHELKLWIRSKIEGMRRPLEFGLPLFSEGYNQALTDVLKALTEGDV